MHEVGNLKQVYTMMHGQKKIKLCITFFFNFLFIQEEASEIMYTWPCACHESIWRRGSTAPHLWKLACLVSFIYRYPTTKDSGKRITRHNNVGDKVQFCDRQPVTRIQTSASPCNWNLQFHQLGSFRLHSHGLWPRAVRYVVMKRSFGTCYLNFKDTKQDGCKKFLWNVQHMPNYTAS